MKEIQPFLIWVGGSNVSARFMSLNLFNDDLNSKAFFNWKLFTIDGEQLQSGTLCLLGEDYINWDGSNVAAWDFAVSSLGVILA